MSETTAVLNGVTVLDLTNVLAGPFCGHQLAHLGARVIKIEATGSGDLARSLGADEALNGNGMGISFLAQNAGKESVAINLKEPAGKSVLKSLVSHADVLVENFRPGVMQRLSLGYDELKTVNPELIYCAISGFGQRGAWSDRPAYDQIVQGLSGVMAITGDRDSAPLRVGYPVADTIGGLTAAMAICAALNRQPRGTLLDVSMLESVIATMGWAVSNYLIGGVTPVPAGNENLTSAPSAAFQAADGLLNIAANKQEQWEVLVQHLGLPALVDDPRFLTRKDRKQNRQALKSALETVLVTQTAEAWADALNAIGVPAGPVLGVPDILEHPLLAEREFLAEYPAIDGVDRPIRIARTGVKVDGEAPAVEAPPPQLGQHTDSVLGEIGYGAAELDRLRQQGVIQ